MYPDLAREHITLCAIITEKDYLSASARKLRRLRWMDVLQNRLIGTKPGVRKTGGVGKRAASVVVAPLMGLYNKLGEASRIGRSISQYTACAVSETSQPRRRP